MLLFCFSFSLLNVIIINTAYAEQKDIKNDQKITPDRINGKVTDIVEVTGYTYVEVDTGKKKVWAAGPITPLKMGDTITFLTDMPMENFHSKSMKRDFPIIYFVGHFITDNESLITNAATASSPHDRLQQKKVIKHFKGINKVEGGNTIAEIHSQKQNLNGKIIRVRGQVTKFNGEIMGKNWLHIRDSSTLDDLIVTTDSTTAIDDIVIIEGKLGLDKDYSYGYVYPVILEDAKIIEE